MSVKTNISDKDLIDYVYSIAGNHLENKIKDWSDWQYWRATVLELPEPVIYTYCIGILNNQVINGGFLQYYDNRYGIFCRETVKAFESIKASATSQIVSDSILTLEKLKEPNIDLLDFIVNNEFWGNQQLESDLGLLDDKYYALEDEEDLGKLLGDYLRNQRIE